MYRVFLLLLLELALTSCHLTVPLNFSISLPCFLDNTPLLTEAEFSWRFTPAGTRDERVLNERGKILHLTNVNAEHDGQYKCVQEGWKGDDRVRMGRTFTVLVEGPLLFQEWRVIRTEAESEVILPCQIPKSSSPGSIKKPPVVWKREITGKVTPLNPKDKDKDHQQKDNTISSRVFWETSPEEQDWSIKIDKVTEEDAGMYHCAIRGSSEVMMVELVVKAPPPHRCAGHTHPWETCNDPESRSGESILRESLVHFSTTVYSYLKGSKPSTNLIFSPISIASVLSNLLLGARAETRTQLESSLKLPNNFTCVHSEMKRLKQATKDTLGMASTIYYASDQRLGEAFINQSLTFYDAVPQKLTNDSDHNVKLINNWVKEKTNGKITNLVEEVDPSTLFVLLNAVYFNGKWKMQFESMSKEAQFTKFSGEVENVPSLFSSKYKLAMSYNKKLKADVGRFPLTGKTSLYILLPRTESEESFLVMERNMDFSTISEMVSEMNKTQIQTAEVTLPKIKLAVTTPLENLLRNLGLQDLFNDPNLCGMTPTETPISDARHSAFLALTERGVEGAAATSLSLSRSFPFFTALQPFVFIVWSDEAGIPLFMGRIVDP